MVIRILMIDDHSSMIEGYKAMLTLNKAQHIIETEEAYSCEEAYTIIIDPQKSTTFDLVFLDYSILGFPEQKIYNGEDLGVLIRKHMPNTKIIMLTSHFDAIRLYNVVKKIQPNGLLVKSDYKPPHLLDAFEKVLAGETYFTPVAIEKTKEPLFTKGLLDSVDREIITLLAEGFVIKTIANKMNVSEDTIKKRKSKIKDLLGIEKGGDEDILKECRALGLL
ncbi:response regulator transcription factor [Flavobacterium sp. SUN052]|uniref:response regulator transcription factor n=1 Tax=Flavobacterium sp. SUN052 TaxID=3002441 RepID=UPI00237E3362|nr:response regulator transcription factor [Flavobacterium sp. SUN052]MEC4004307.1 response regulator transcription factor [Flavobacterium sp. SUN052]